MLNGQYEDRMNIATYTLGSNKKKKKKKYFLGKVTRVRYFCEKLGSYMIQLPVEFFYFLLFQISFYIIMISADITFLQLCKALLFNIIWN